MTPRRMRGGFIRAQLQMSNMSLRQLSALAAVSNSYLRQVERGLHDPARPRITRRTQMFEGPSSAIARHQRHCGRFLDLTHRSVGNGHGRRQEVAA